MKRYYDRAKGALVYISEENERADTEFWDSQWKKHGVNAIFKNPPRNSAIVKLTGKFLAPGAIILEGGCGMGDKVYRLKEAGYDVHGVDYAANTVSVINTHWPELNIQVADVRELPFPDDYFDGYWSIGVIEHFYSGYDAIASEMKRVIKPGGYLFLSFPCMNRMRQVKARHGEYPEFDEKAVNLGNFYQFALDAEATGRDFEKNGFELVWSAESAGFKNFKDESRILSAPLTRLQQSSNLVARAARRSLDVLLSRIAGHIVVMVFKKKGAAG